MLQVLYCFQRYGSEGMKAIAGKDETRYLRDQVMELESIVEKMQLEAKEREQHLRGEKISLDQVSCRHLNHNIESQRK